MDVILKADDPCLVSEKNEGKRKKKDRKKERKVGFVGFVEFKVSVFDSLRLQHYFRIGILNGKGR